jgi:hypothetical protein
VGIEELPMSSRISVEQSESGCWLVKRGEYVLAIFPRHYWKDALREAHVEARYNNLGIIGLEFV